jgi:O-antigen/teichoic acid export membrane protein
VETLVSSKSSAGRRLSTITVDQAIAGLSNVFIAVLAARALGVAAFGFFGIVFIVYVTAQGASRALICEPLLVHPAEAEERPADVIGTASVLGLVLAAVVVVSGLVADLWSADLGNALVVLGACLPLLVLQDLGRYLAFATHRPARALTLDVVWLVLVVAGVVALSLADRSSLTWFIVAWAGSGALAGLLVFVQYRIRRLRFSLSWLRETWAYSWRYLVSFSATQGAALLTSVGVGAVAGARALGAVRGAILLTRPVGLVQAASIAAGTAEISRLEPGSAAVRRHVNRTTMLTTGLALANMAVLLVLPDALGRLVLGATWEPTQELLLPATVQIVMLGLVCGTRAGLTGMRAVKKTVRIDVVSTVIVSAATVAGAVIDGALGAYWALVIAQGVSAVIWWSVYLTHDPRTPTPGATYPPAEAPSPPATQLSEGT